MIHAWPLCLGLLPLVIGQDWIELLKVCLSSTLLSLFLVAWVWAVLASFINLTPDVEAHYVAQVVFIFRVQATVKRAVEQVACYTKAAIIVTWVI